MFGNRRRKLQDEEESLVPHGLIWHATGEPTPEEAAKNEETLGYTVDYAQEIERVRRPLPDTTSDPVPEAASEVPVPRPAVIPWWRMEQPEAPPETPKSKLAPMPLSAYVPTPVEPNLEAPRPSRIQPMQIRPTPIPTTPVAPIEIQHTSAQAPQPEILSLPLRENKPAEICQASTPQTQGALATDIRISQPGLHEADVHRARTDEPLVPNPSEITESFRLAFARFSSVCKSAWLRLIAVSTNATEQSLQRLRSLELGRQFSEAGKQGQNLVRAGLSRTGRYARSAGGAIGSYSRTGIESVRHASMKVRASSASSTTDVVRPASHEAATPSRIQALTVASVLRARIMVARQLSEWRIRRQRVAVDSRFWASMSMAAVAAVIALVIVSVVPHYAARSLPSRILNTNTSVDASVVSRPAAPTAQVTPTVPVKTFAPARKSVATAGSHPAPAKAASIKPVTRTASAAKPRHAAYDDYVAPDTYKYYGSGSKPSR